MALRGERGTCGEEMRKTKTVNKSETERETNEVNEEEQEEKRRNRETNPKISSRLLCPGVRF
jgi:hypothetical protein